MSNNVKTNTQSNLEKLLQMEESAPIIEHIEKEHDVDLHKKPDLPATANNDDETKDYIYVRENLMQLIENSENVLETLKSLAEQSQNARTFEVLTGLIKTIVEANRDLMDLHKKRKELNIMDKEISGEGNQSGNNGDTYNQTAVFVGSTTELQKYLKNKNNE